LAFVAVFVLVPLATGAVIGALGASGHSFTLAIAPEVWIATTIAAAAAVARSGGQYGRSAMALGATGTAIAYGLVAFPLLTLLGYLVVSPNGVG
jgi:hypothetical protein